MTARGWARGPTARSASAPPSTWTALLGSIVLGLVLSGCGLGPDAPDDDLGRNRQRWLSQRIEDYRVQFRLICFCVPDATAPVILTVRGGAIVSVARVSDGRTVDPSQWRGRYYTVDEMFALIREARSRGASEVRVSYDPMLGYPTDVYIDQDARTIDEERQFQLGDLVPAR